MANNKRIYLSLAHMIVAGLEQKCIQEVFDTNWVKLITDEDVIFIIDTIKNAI